MTDELSPEKIAEVHEVFSLFDKDADGAINTHQLGAALRSLGFNPADSEIVQLAEEADADGSGSLDFSEFLMLLPRVETSGDSIEEVDEAFRVFDKELSGYLSIAELRHILTSLGEKLTDEEVDEMLTHAEIDERGEIRYGDFIERLLETDPGPKNLF